MGREAGRQGVAVEEERVRGGGREEEEEVREKRYERKECGRIRERTGDRGGERREGKEEGGQDRSRVDTAGHNSRYGQRRRTGGGSGDSRVAAVGGGGRAERWPESPRTVAKSAALITSGFVSQQHDPDSHIDMDVLLTPAVKVCLALHAASMDRAAKIRPKSPRGSAPCEDGFANSQSTQRM